MFKNGREKLNVPETGLPFKPFTTKEISDVIRKRVFRIDEEFTKGFEFIKRYPSSVTFFGSTRVKEDDLYYNKAVSLAKKLSQIGYSIMTGGGPGIMEAANRGAYEAGGDSLGLNIKLPKQQVTNPYVKESVEFFYFFSRKVCLSFSAEAFIFFPGGFGTLDELFEIITLIQTHKIHKRPVILFGKEHWYSLNDFITHHLLERGAIDKEDMELYKITDSEEEAIQIIKASNDFSKKV